MRKHYVIKHPIKGDYWSIENEWDELFMTITFSEEDDALKYAYNNVETCFTIEKIYNLI